MVRDELKQGGASLSLSLRRVWQSRDIPSDESPSLSLSLIPVYPLTAYSGSAAFLVAPLSFCLLLSPMAFLKGFFQFEVSGSGIMTRGFLYTLNVEPVL